MQAGCARAIEVFACFSSQCGLSPLENDLIAESPTEHTRPNAAAAGPSLRPCSSQAHRQHAALSQQCRFQVTKAANQLQQLQAGQAHMLDQGGEKSRSGSTWQHLGLRQVLALLQNASS